MRRLLSAALIEVAIVFWNVGDWLEDRANGITGNVLALPDRAEPVETALTLFDPPGRLIQFPMERVT